MWVLINSYMYLYKYKVLFGYYLRKCFLIAKEQLSASLSQLIKKNKELCNEIIGLYRLSQGRM